MEYWLLSFWSEEYNILLEEAKQFSADIDWQGENYWEMPERYRPSSLLRMIAENDRLSQEVGRKSAESYLPLTVTIDAAALNSEEKLFSSYGSTPSSSLPIAWTKIRRWLSKTRWLMLSWKSTAEASMATIHDALSVTVSSLATGGSL